MHEISDLPIHEHRSKITGAIQSNRVVVISGKTGCGKSTQVPKYILEDFSGSYIAVCEPRRLAATSLAMRVSEELHSDIGVQVGYQIGMESKCSDKTRIIFMTYGILIQQLLFSKHIEYTHIILDEVHERSLEMDFTFIALKKILDSQTKLKTKVIIMSATINSSQFAKHFSTHIETLEFLKPTIEYKEDKKYKHRGRRGGEEIPKVITADVNFERDNYQEAESIELPEKTLYKTVEYFAENISGNGYIPQYTIDEDVRIREDTYILAISLVAEHQQKSKGDILIFVPGMFEIKTLKDKLIEGNKVDKEQIVEVHSAYSEELYQKLFKNKTKNKVIIATNIGESSITLPFCKVVIDFCLTRKNITIKTKGYSRFETRVASKANLLQRAGRVGRIADGTVYRLISKSFYHDLDDFDIPEIKCVSLDMVILRAKQIDKTYNSNLFEDPYEVFFNAIEPPKFSEIHEAIEYLIKEEALIVQNESTENEVMKYTGSDLILTKMGQFMVTMPCNIRISKMILLSLEIGIAPTIIDIAAILLTQKTFFVHEEKRYNIEEFVHSIVGYDRGDYNDFLLRQRMFSHWRTYFFEYFYERNYKHHEKFKQQNTIDRALEHFNNEKINNEEWDWCDDRGVSPHVMRDILRISENIRERLRTAEMKVEIGNEEIRNEFVILCLCIAFEDTTCELDWKMKNVYSKGVAGENYVSIIESNSTTEENIANFMSPLPFPEITYEKGGFMKIKGSCQALSKLLLPKCFVKSRLDRTSPLYRYLATHPPKVSYIYENGFVREKVREVTILNDSINKINIRPNQFEDYMLVSDKIFDSKGKYYMGPCALIEKKKLILIKMMTAKEVLLEPHVSYEFYSRVFINGDPMELPFFVNEEDIEIILEFRKFSQEDKSRKLEEGRLIGNSKRSKFERLLGDIKVKPKVEQWTYIYNEIVEGYKNFIEQPLNINKLKKLKEAKTGTTYFDRYQKWKKQEYFDLYLRFKELTTKQASIICSKCWPQEITIIDDLDSFDTSKRILNLNEYRGSWTSNKEELFCSKKHKIGKMLNQDEGALENQNILMYAPISKVAKFDGRKESIELMKRNVAKGVEEIEKAKENIQEFECKICSTYDDYDKLKRVAFTKFQDTQMFWKKISEHMYSRKHMENLEKFLLVS